MHEEALAVAGQEQRAMDELKVRYGNVGLDVGRSTRVRAGQLRARWWGVKGGRGTSMCVAGHWASVGPRV